MISLQNNQNDLVKFLLLIIIYSIFGCFTQFLALPAGQIPSIFPAGGIALYFLYRWGNRFWVSIFLGSLIVGNLSGSEIGISSISGKESWGQSLVSAGGESLQAFIGAFFLKKIKEIGFLYKVKNSLYFVIFCGTLCPLISPTINSLFIHLANNIEWRQLGWYVLTGWLANSIGILIMIPLIDWIFKKERVEFDLFQKIELLIFLVLIFIIGQLVFGGLLQKSSYPLVYTLFPFLIWAVFRFENWGGILAVILVCGFATLGSIKGGGPFVGRPYLESIILLQVYCWLVSSMTHFLSVAIHERRSTETNLINSEKRLRLITDNLPILIAYLDENGNNKFSNKPYQDCFGFTQDEITGMNFKNVIGEASFQNIQEFYKKALSGNFVNFESKVLDKVGKKIWVEITMVPHISDLKKIEGTFVLAQDITARKKLEEALKNENRKVKEIINSLPAEIAVLDCQGNIEMVNKTWMEYSKKHWKFSSESGFVGINYLEVCENSGESEIHENIEKVLKGEISEYSAEYQRDRISGSKKFLMLVNSLGEGIRGALISFIDITDQKKAEERLEEYKDQLEGLVLKRTKELIKANDKLKNEIRERKKIEQNLIISREELRNLNNKLSTVREEEKVRIAREIHDELGQLLTAFKFDLTWLRKWIEEPSFKIKSKIDEMFSNIDNSINSVRRISSELRPKILDDLGLSEAVKWLANDFKRKTQIDYILRIEPDDISINSNLSIELFRVFQEILTNVARHSKATNLDIELIESRKHLRLKVVDNGIGIQSYKINDSKSLGLIGLRERAYLWKGQVEIIGVENSGTTVIVTIPKNNKNKYEQKI